MNDWQERREREERLYLEERRKQDALWEATVRSNLDSLRANRAEPWLLERLAREYLGTLEEFLIEPKSGWRVQAPEHRSAAMEGLRGTPWRDDVPDDDEIIRLHRMGRRHRLGLPFLAGLEIIEREDPRRLDSLDEAQERQSLAFHYLEGGSRLEPPDWHRRLVQTKPELTAAVLVHWAKATFRRENPTLVHLGALLRDRAQAKVARRAVLPLLTAFSVRKKADWHRVLDLLLWTAIARADRKEFRDLVERKLGAKSMTIAQRAHWVAAGLAAAPDRYHDRFEELTRDEEALREAAGFLCADLPTRFPTEECEVATLRLLITRLGGMFPPNDPEADEDEDDDRAMGRFLGLPDFAAEFTGRCIEELGSRPTAEASDALGALHGDASLARWKRKVLGSLKQQRIVRRDAEYRPPTIHEVANTLGDRAPTSAGGLARLVLDHFDDLKDDLRWGEGNLWRPFWNEDRNGKPTEPKPENSCRDALCDLLRQRGVPVQVEVTRPGSLRADLGVEGPGGSVWFEIKFDKSRDLWTAMTKQLIPKYLAPGDRGIYLVLWTGSGNMPWPQTGSRPTTPEALQERLRDSLTAEEGDRLEVRVLDVRSPKQRLADDE